MVDQADEKKKGTDTARPPKDDEASDLYSSATVVRDTPSDLKDLIKQSNEGANRPVTVPPNSRLPKDLTGEAKASPTMPSPSTARPSDTTTSQTAKTAPPPSSSRKNNEPPLSVRKPDAPKKPDVPNKVDDLWEALLPKRSGDDDDDDDGPSGSASGHAAEDVTKMLMVPEGLLPEDPLEELSPDALRRIAEAQPSIVVDAAIPATHSTVPSKSSVPPRMSSEPPPSAAKPRKKDDEDEGMVTSPGRNVPPSDRERIRSMVLAIGALVLLAIAVYYVAQP